MGFPIGLIGKIIAIIEMALQTIEVAEKMFKGSGRGGAKKQAVVNTVMDTFESEVGLLADGVEPQQYYERNGSVLGGLGLTLGGVNWACIATKIPQIYTVVGDIVDKLVELLNIFKDCQDDKGSGPVF